MVEPAPIVPAVPVQPAETTAAASSPSWLPDSNVARGGIVAVGSWAVLAIAGHYGLDVPIAIQAAIPGALTWLIIYFLPPSASDVAKRLNDRIVALAAALPTSQVSAR